MRCYCSRYVSLTACVGPSFAQGGTIDSLRLYARNLSAAAVAARNHTLQWTRPSEFESADVKLNSETSCREAVEILTRTPKKRRCGFAEVLPSISLLCAAVLHSTILAFTETLG